MPIQVGEHTLGEGPNPGAVIPDPDRSAFGAAWWDDGVEGLVDALRVPDL